MTTVCALRHRRVVDESGHERGRVFDLHCRWGGAPPVVEALECGERGWLERVGYRRGGSGKVKWDAVERIEDDRIVVRDRD